MTEYNWFYSALLLLHVRLPAFLVNSTSVIGSKSFCYNNGYMMIANCII